MGPVDPFSGEYNDNMLQNLLSDMQKKEQEKYNAVIDDDILSTGTFDDMINDVHLDLDDNDIDLDDVFNDSMVITDNTCKNSDSNEKDSTDSQHYGCSDIVLSEMQVTPIKSMNNPVCYTSMSSSSQHQEHATIKSNLQDDKKAEISNSFRNDNDYTKK